jgi:hypothetical protein
MPVALGLMVVWAVAADINMPSQQPCLVETAPQMRGLVCWSHTTKTAFRQGKPPISLENLL